MQMTDITRPTATEVLKIIIDVHDRLPRFPNAQKVNFCNCSAVLKYVSVPTMALVKLPNISPTINIAVVSRSFRETARTANSTTKLPRHDAMMIPYGERISGANTDGSKAVPRITNATPRLDPELCQRSYGPASGFLNNVCIKSPLTDNPIPAIAAVIAFGNR